MGPALDQRDACDTKAQQYLCCDTARLPPRSTGLRVVRPLSLLGSGKSQARSSLRLIARDILAAVQPLCTDPYV